MDDPAPVEGTFFVTMLLTISEAHSFPFHATTRFNKYLKENSKKFQKHAREKQERSKGNPAFVHAFFHKK